MHDSNPNISETTLDSEYHCAIIQLSPVLQLWQIVLLDPTYTTLGGIETAVLEDAKSHFAENESELQPQHCPLEKETDEDGLQSLANPNAAVDKLKIKIKWQQ